MVSTVTGEGFGGRGRRPAGSGPRRARVLLVTLLCCGAPGALVAHEIHSTLTEIVVAGDGRLVIRIRTFADDFSAAVARHVNGTPRPNHVVADADAARYLKAVFVLTARSGAPAPVYLVSQQRTGDVVWLELTTPRMPVAGASVRNAMLFEVHRDQVNIVQARYGHTAFTTLFSRGDRARKLP